MSDETYQYDVGLSFAGEQRQYVEEVAANLKSRGIRIFYDDYEKETLWGKDLYEHLSEIFQHMCEYCVIFISKEYAEKVLPTRERQSAQARAMKEKTEYILPARFDDTTIPGLLETIGYIDLNDTSPKQLADLITSKLGKQIRQNYLPPTLDRLFERLRIEHDQTTQSEVSSIAWLFLDSLRRMTAEERHAVISLIQCGCPAGLPDNIHINTDLLRRHTGMSVARLKRLLGGVRSLGFRCSVAEDTEHEASIPGETLGDTYLFYLKWLDLSDRDGDFPELLVAHEMIAGATENYCEVHGAEFLDRLDFSQLASATASRESHRPES